MYGQLGYMSDMTFMYDRPNGHRLHDGHDDRHLRSMNVPALLCHRPDIVAFMMQSDFLM